MSYCNEPTYDIDDDFVYIEELLRYEDAKELVEDLIHHIYNTGSVPSIEDALEEVANIWDLKLPSGNPRISKKQDNIFFNMGAQMMTQASVRSTTSSTRL